MFLASARPAVTHSSCQILTGVIKGHFFLDYTAALFHLLVQLRLAAPQLLLAASYRLVVSLRIMARASQSSEKKIIQLQCNTFLMELISPQNAKKKNATAESFKTREEIKMPKQNLLN